MPTERIRHQLYEELKEVLSVDSADELMAYLPPVGWADVATRSDVTMVRSEIDAFRAEMRSETSSVSSGLRGEMSGLRSEMSSDMSNLRSEIDAFRAEMRSDMSGLRSEMMSEMSGLRSEMMSEMKGLRLEVSTELASGMADLQRWTITTLIAMTGLFGALVFAAVKLGG